ncbi:hypothetical protein JW848_03225, partial [Candidatus Bipolaricaulota bacterium]|nr:hypothetical protein [Candidatus Bipolaricaulota bacterium]
LFAFDKPFFPADTHIARVTKRLGWVDPAARDPHDALNARIAADPLLMKKLHLLLIRLGREVCRARRAVCGMCPLHDVCPTGEEIQAEGGGDLALPGEAG